MFKKIIFAAVILFNFFIPVLVNAEVTGANSDIPALNPFCWKKKDCVNARRSFVEGNPTDKELADNGFISNSSVAPCNTGTGDQQWGRCLPAGVTKTEISFGGQDKFSNIGDFILLMYKWLVTVASILAVIMIIVSGVQWITSGGNSESISSAKSRISGAVIGLFIAYMSYFILNTINPNLVNFRIPQVWLVRPQSLMPEFCADALIKGQKLQYAYVSDVGKENDPLPPANQLQYTTMKEKDLGCGKGFLVENGGESRCFGHFCPKTDGKNSMCVKGDNYFCAEGDLSVKLMLDDSDISNQVQGELGKLPVVGLAFSKALKTPDWLSDDVRVRAVCKKVSGTSVGMLYLADFKGSAIDHLYGGVEWSDKIKKVVTKTGGNNIYTHVFSGLQDFNKLNEVFDCNIGEYKDAPGAAIKTSLMVGYFITYRVRADESWLGQHASPLKFAAAGAGVGTVVGWFLPGIGTLSGAGIGYVVGELVNGPAGPPEPHLNIGYGNGNGIFGLYASPALRKAKPQYENVADIKSLGSYIPGDKLKNGLRLEVHFDLQTLGKILLYPSNRPVDDGEVFWRP